jgi:hypothetical protein
VPLATTFLCYLALAYGNSNSVSSGIISPLVFVFLISYFVAAAFAELFGMGIESILFCFIADEEMFEPERRFAPRDLAQVIRETAAQRDAQKKRRQNQKETREGENASESEAEAAVEKDNYLEVRRDFMTKKLNLIDNAYSLII